MVYCYYKNEADKAKRCILFLLLFIEFSSLSSLYYVLVIKVTNIHITNLNLTYKIEEKLLLLPLLLSCRF